MTQHDSSESGSDATGPSAQDLEALAEQTQRVIQAFWEREGQEPSANDFSIIDAPGVIRAFAAVSQSLWSDPAKLVEAQMKLWEDNLALWETMRKRMTGEEAEPVAAPERGDRRFSNKAWEEDIFFDYLKQSYLVSSHWIQSLVEGAETDEQTKQKASFFTRQYLSAMAPSNFAATNPAVLKATRESQGQNLVKGMEHMLADLEKGKGRLKISMTDDSAFEVGKNVAVSPGKVVFQNDLMQLIQYSPTTEQVHKRPLLIVPPWINKFYVLDLQPKNSFIKFAVDQGYTVFIISWVNPNQELANKSFADYMLEGPVAALDAVEQAIDCSEINLLGFCIGGILSVATLAYLAEHGDTRIKSASFLATMVDMKDVGEAAIFIDQDQIARLKEHVSKKGYLEGHHMADMFSMMRENDLIWSFVVNNYLMGRDPMPFDLLYWNADSTRLPASMLLFYLEHFYIENALTKPCEIVLDKVPIDLGKITIPLYSIATKDDHIAPWPSCYALTQATKAPLRFVLGASGHIAGIVNPPERNKYGYWTNTKKPKDPEKWLEGATQHEGSWWPDWEKWLHKHGGPMVPARDPAAGGLPAIEDAPGSYVKVRMPE